VSLANLMRSFTRSNLILAEFKIFALSCEFGIENNSSNISRVKLSNFCPKV